MCIFSSDSKLLVIPNADEPTTFSKPYGLLQPYVPSAEPRAARKALLVLPVPNEAGAACSHIRSTSVTTAVQNLGLEETGGPVADLDEPALNAIAAMEEEDAEIKCPTKANQKLWQVSTQLVDRDQYTYGSLRTRLALPFGLSIPLPSPRSRHPRLSKPLARPNLGLRRICGPRP
jgi:hypothetical protein